MLLYSGSVAQYRAEIWVSIVHGSSDRLWGPGMDAAGWDVVIVDDEVDNIGVVKLVLEFNDVNVRTAESGAECLSLLEDEKPSLLLVDIQMPEMSGYELLETIRANDHWKNLPVIAITAHAMPEDSHQIISAGFDGYIAKPINVATLLDEIRQAIEVRNGEAGKR